jgi:hypothetical protein
MNQISIPIVMNGKLIVKISNKECIKENVIDYLLSKIVGIDIDDIELSQDEAITTEKIR